MTKRYFWRRFLAFMIDGFVMNLIVAIPVLLVSSIFAASTVSPIAYSNDCKLGQPPADLVRLMDIQPDDQVSVFECKSSALFEKGSKVFTVFLTKQDGKPHFPRMVSFRDDGSGFQMMPDTLELIAVLPQTGIVLLLPAAFAVFSAYGRQTLGKKLMRLRVVRTDDSYPMLPQALAREYWKFMPNLLLFAIILVVGLTMRDTITGYLDDAFENLDSIKFFKLFAIIPAIQLLVALWWLAPFIFWRGQTWHDRLAGTKVIRTEPA